MANPKILKINSEEYGESTETWEVFANAWESEPKLLEAVRSLKVGESHTFEVNDDLLDRLLITRLE